MRIGILTFHWATNYGAVLQCYALQSFLSSMGHEVKVIDYKPERYDMTAMRFIRSQKFRELREYVRTYRKERSLDRFRKRCLNLTQRVYSCENVSEVASGFDVVISGSDQVGSPFFLMNGESRGHVTPTYFLGFPFEGKRIGYALSFGCVTYPDDALDVARKYIGGFDRLSAREKSGLEIIRAMGRDDAEIVPDPAILMDSSRFLALAEEGRPVRVRDYVYGFFIRNQKERKLLLSNVLRGRRLAWNNDDGDYSMSGWLRKIKDSESVVTDSFHCAVACLKMRKPFSVVTEEKGLAGMNDRFYTLLGRLGLEDHIVFKSDAEAIPGILSASIDWKRVDDGLEELRSVAESYLDNL